MCFDQDIYLIEMKSMVDGAFNRLLEEKPDYEIYTISIWTDPNAAVSSINIDSKVHSDQKITQSNQWAEKYYLQYIAEGDLEQAKLFEPRTGRNFNPADFELRDFEEVKNISIPRHWEEKTDGDCWDVLEPLLKIVGDYAFDNSMQLKRRSDFELSVNGRLDWYEFTWPKADNSI